MLFWQIYVLTYCNILIYTILSIYIVYIHIAVIDPAGEGHSGETDHCWSLAIVERRRRKAVFVSMESGSCGRLANGSHYAFNSPDHIHFNLRASRKAINSSSCAETLGRAHLIKDGKGLRRKTASIPNPAGPFVHSECYRTGAPALTVAVSLPAIQLG